MKVAYRRHSGLAPNLSHERCYSVKCPSKAVRARNPLAFELESAATTIRIVSTSGYHHPRA